MHKARLASQNCKDINSYLAWDAKKVVILAAASITQSRNDAFLKALLAKNLLVWFENQSRN